MAAEVGVLAAIQFAYDEAKKRLENVEEDIRKITGREPPTEFRKRDSRFEDGPPSKKRIISSAFRRLGSHKEDSRDISRTQDHQNNSSTAPRELGTQKQDLQDEGSGEEDEPTTKPSLQSSVVATVTSVRTRKATLEAQKGDRKNMERNRRMFGMILGTLQKFQREESSRKEQTQKREEIEKKLEEAAVQEKEEALKRKKQLFRERRKKQAEIRCLDQKMELARIHDEWESRQRLLMKFIQTKTRPHIMYLPAKASPESEKRLRESQQKRQEIIVAQSAKIQEELQEIDELYQRDEEPEEEPEQPETGIDKENKGPGDGEGEMVEEQVEMKAEKLNHTEEETPQVTEGKEVGDGDVNVGIAVLENVVVPSETEGEKEQDNKNSQPIESLGDQEFEPIYDDD
ncbi:pinin-like [Limulus polyphemus]|uniref:Pinin n=1 Tax=Limulus polyphemus TaxID=6850 RepID=A0ABM1B2V6_LIMPO|nr:pinin-like [Limulus polyphemus]